jgi:predicted GNAT family acetyltransferase
MKFNLYKDVKPFHAAVFDILMHNEVQNILPLGNVIIGNEGKDKTGWRDPANWLMATVSDAAGIRITAIMTPPHNIALYATDNQKNETALDVLIAGLLAENTEIPGVTTEKSLALDFAEKYTRAKNLTYEISTNQRIYELQKVTAQSASQNKIRLIEEKDLHFFPYWYACMMHDFRGEPIQIGDDIESFNHLIDIKSVYVLEADGIPVTTARSSRPMQNVCGVSGVYTPPYFRKKGYATDCVSQLSQIILDKGFARCALYTDLANPVSNSIYQKIGYMPVCDSLEIKFEG